MHSVIPEIVIEGSVTKNCGKESCQFSHDIPVNMRQNTELTSQVRRRIQLRNICINEYRRSDSCKKKGQCSFRHEIENYERRDPEIQRAMDEKWEKITQSKTKSVTPNQNTIQEALEVMAKLKELVNSFNITGRHP